MKSESLSKGPGQSFRKGLSLLQLIEMFPDDQSAEAWLIQQRWPDGVACVRCGAQNIQNRASRKPQPYRCRDCRKDFSVKSDSLMHSSPLGCRIWVIAMYLLTTNIKGVSSMKLHRDLGITQKSAWHLLHRLRENFSDHQPSLFAGPTEVDETYVGGKERNKHFDKKLRYGRGPAGKTAVVGAKDRDTNQVSAKVVERTNKPTLQGFVVGHAKPGSTVYTDEHRSYFGLHGDYRHATVQHKIKMWVDGQAHTNGIESFWSLLKRGYIGTYHRISPKHLQRYINEFCGRHNARRLDTIDQMAAIVRGSSGKRLPYQDLVT